MAKKAGFHVPATNELVVTWDEGHDYHGAVIKLSLDLPMDMLFRFQKQRREPGEEATQEQRDAQESLMREFGDSAILEWNLVDNDGEPIPPTGAGFLTQSFSFAGEVFKRWASIANASDAIDGPLAESSDKPPSS